ncbi:MAG: hypothetical protein WC421_11415 [Elusimicrobiales bacterium]
MKLVLATMLALGALSRPAAAQSDANADRQEFRNLLGSLATQSQSRPLECKRMYLMQEFGAEEADVQYAFSVQDYSSYKDAFFLNYVDEKKNHYSAFVAYEGENGNIKGKLNVMKTSSGMLYQHILRTGPVAKDYMELSVSDGKPYSLSYLKTDKQGIGTFRIYCKAAQGE